MGLNIQKGNMYDWVDSTWNTVKGKCSHNCGYCFMKRFGEQKPIRFDESELETDLGEKNTIFIGSSCDLWAWDIPTLWIFKTLEHAKKYPFNNYVFQSKNPHRFMKFYGMFPEFTLFGTTIESNREYDIYNQAPSILDRYGSIHTVGKEDGGDVFVSIEPMLDFDIKEFTTMIFDIEPRFVSIGADSQGHDLPEPDAGKLKEFIKELKSYGEMEVKIKNNLNRLLR